MRPDYVCNLPVELVELVEHVMVWVRATIQLEDHSQTSSSMISPHPITSNSAPFEATKPYGIILIVDRQ